MFLVCKYLRAIVIMRKSTNSHQCHQLLSDHQIPICFITAILFSVQFRKAREPSSIHKCVCFMRFGSASLAAQTFHCSRVYITSFTSAIPSYKFLNECYKMMFIALLINYIIIIMEFCYTRVPATRELYSCLFK